MPFRPETLEALAQHPQVVAVKDAKLDLGAAWLCKRTDLAIYSGQDEYTLPLLAVGAVGFGQRRQPRRRASACSRWSPRSPAATRRGARESTSS